MSSLTRFTILAGLVALTACGGGGSASNDSQPEAPAGSERISIPTSTTNNHMTQMSSGNFGGVMVSNPMLFQGTQSSEHYEQSDAMMALSKKKVNFSLRVMSDHLETGVPVGRSKEE